MVGRRDAMPRGEVAIPGEGIGEGAGRSSSHFVGAITKLGGERFNDVITIISD